MQLGRIIAGKYCLLHELGRGGMGTVWVAEHIGLRSKVALKLIDPQMGASPHGQARFEREARALAALRSPNVVQVLDYGVEQGVQYLVTELLQGQTLRHALLARTRLRPDEVWSLVEQVSRALSVSHASGFVHRDLKPENLFLVSEEDDRFLVKVLDFGITKPLASEAAPLTATGGVLGTCEYMSPEQTIGSEIDTRSDLWSLGVVTFEALVGRSPFKAKSAMAVMTAVCQGPIVVPSTVARVPAGFDAWFARAVQRDPEKRFQTAKELVAALRPVLESPKEYLGDDPLPPLDEERTLRVDASATSPFERRRDGRIPSSIPAAVDGQRDLLNAALLYNASRSGALLATRRTWGRGETIALTLHLDSAYDGETVHARIVRTVQRDSPLWKFDVAVRFVTPLTDEMLSRIEARARARR